MKPSAPGGRKRFILIALTLALAFTLVAGLLFGRPVVHWFKRWRALQLTEASIQALNANDLATAETKANAAYQLWPFDASVQRQVARVMDLKNPRQAELIWASTYKLSHDNEDLRHWIDAEVVNENIPGAVEEYNHLTQLDTNNPQTWLTGARVLLADNEWPEALDILQKLLDSGQAPDDAILLYVQAAKLSQDPAVRLKGLDLLHKLSTRSDLLGLRALRALAGYPYPGETPEDVTKIADQLQNHPLATRDDKLAALTLRGMLPGANDDNLIQSARDLFPPGDSQALVDVGRWLINQNKNADVLKLIDADTALTRRDLFLVRLDALAGTGNWQAVEDVLNAKNLPIPEELRLLFLARTESELGHSDHADLAWDKVLAYVGDNPAKLRDVADYAMKLRLDDIARPALLKLTQNADTTQRRTAFEQLVNLERRAHHTQALHDVLADMQRIFINDPIVANDLLYTGFLLGDATPDKIAEAQKLSDHPPIMLSYKVTLALGYLTAHNPTAAEKVFSDLPSKIDWPTTYNAWRAVEVGVLRANGHLPDANTLAKTIDSADLLPEEHELLSYPLPTMSP
jgi:tetratricopeptide (TPR) repeat protein